jgi:hypothetical protein
VRFKDDSIKLPVLFKMFAAYEIQLESWNLLCAFHMLRLVTAFQVGSSSNAVDLYSGGAWFEFGS